MTTPDLSAGEFRALYNKLKRKSSWGPDDRKGALNYISSTDVVAAASGVWRGQTVSLARRWKTSRLPTIRSPACTR